MVDGTIKETFICYHSQSSDSISISHCALERISDANEMLSELKLMTVNIILRTNSRISFFDCAKRINNYSYHRARIRIIAPANG